MLSILTHSSIIDSQTRVGTMLREALRVRVACRHLGVGRGPASGWPRAKGLGERQFSCMTSPLTTPRRLCAMGGLECRQFSAVPEEERRGRMLEPTESEHLVPVDQHVVPPLEAAPGPSMLTPPETLEQLRLASLARADRPAEEIFVNSVAGGSYLAVGGCCLYVMVLGQYDMHPLLGAAVFPTGLSLITLTGRATKG